MITSAYVRACACAIVCVCLCLDVRKNGQLLNSCCLYPIGGVFVWF